MSEITYIFAGNIALDVEFNYTPGVPAYVSGLPEDCYPSEDEEIEITGITCNGADIETDDLYIMDNGEPVWIDTLIEDFISTSRETWEEE